MWGIVVKLITSDMAKYLIAMLIKKLLEHKKDGVTKDVAEAMLDGIAQSRANNVSTDLVETIKGAL